MFLGVEFPRIECARRAMLSALTRTFRVKAAIMLAALYALCVLAPAAAFAFSNNPAAAHCLTEGHVGVRNQAQHNQAQQNQAQHNQAQHNHADQVHVHADGTAHQHHDHGTAPQPSNDDGKSPIATCCGLFSVVAIPGGPIPSLEFYSLASVVLPPPGEALSGRGPERINRPPIA
jgi:hypothetical protein